MNVFRSTRRWFRRLAGLLRKGQRDAEFAAELEGHLQFHIEDNLRAGMTPEAARREALIRLGGIEQTKELYRNRRGIPFLEFFWHDLRFGARLLAKDRAFTLTAVLTMALAIGANTAIFSVVNTVLLKPLSYPDPDRLVMAWEQNPHRGWYENIVSAANFLDWQKQNDVFSGMAAFESNNFTLTGENKPEEVAGDARHHEFVFRLANPAFSRPAVPCRRRERGKCCSHIELWAVAGTLRRRPSSGRRLHYCEWAAGQGCGNTSASLH
jgi:hypothetical protein